MPYIIYKQIIIDIILNLFNLLKGEKTNAHIASSYCG